MICKIRTWISGLFSLLLSVALTSCGGADFVGNSYKAGNSITIEYQILNKTETEEIDLISGDSVRFDVTSESGHVDIAFGIKGALPTYEGNSVATGTFTVTVHENGRYILSVTGSDAKGSVKLARRKRT